uniref:HTH psq-type domain-containing protein n=1 Tax=Steinernema glaseri TaxID=37863 RepID=A0A1I7XW53_9BILA
MAAATVLCPVPETSSSASSSSSEESEPLTPTTVSPSSADSGSGDGAQGRRKKKPYKELTLEEKVQLIRLAEENSGMSQASIAERYAIAKSNVCRILQRKAEYLRAFETFAGSRKRKLRGDGGTEPPATAKAPPAPPPPPLHHPVAIHPGEEPPRTTVLRPALHRPLQVLTEPPHCVEPSPNCNETLRAHMYKQHQISRIFMCRCCNWAFPDKTSLHMHMQAKEEGKNISVPVIGKGHAPNTASFSANNGGPFGPSQTSTPAASGLQNPFIPLQLHTLAGLPPHQGLGIGEHNGPTANLFPQLQAAMVPPANSEDLMSKLRDRFLLSSMLNNAAGAAGFPLANWLANFPNVDASGVGKLGGSLDLRFGRKEADEGSEKEIKVDAEGDDDELTVTTTDVDVVKHSDKDSESGDELRGESPMEHSSHGDGSPSISALRSAIKSSALPYMNISDSDDQVAQGSDVSHVSPTETNSSVSPSGAGCYDCTLHKEKLEEAQSRCRYLEDRTATLQTDALRFSSRLSASEAAKQQSEAEVASLRSRLEVLQQRLLQVQEMTVGFVRGADLSNPAAISTLLNDVLQATLLQ